MGWDPLVPTPLPRHLAHVHQVVCEETGRCSYLIACRRTGVAALVDPVPSLELALRAVAGELPVRFVLETRTPRAVQAPPDGAPAWSRYASLLTDLGLDDEPDDAIVEVEPEDLWWSAVPRVGPLAAVAAAKELAPHDSVLLQAGDHHLGVRIPSSPDQERPCTIGGAHERPVAGRICARARIALGAFHVEVLTLPEHRDAVAYHVDNVVFSGLPLRAGGARDGTTETLLTLPPDTIVYPSALTDGLSISSVAQEARWHEEQARSHQRQASVHER